MAPFVPEPVADGALAILGKPLPRTSAVAARR
jgi:hypothetical protein